uniref:Polyprotein n=1 Tax=Cajanus cajan TaxID=3821 RepID=A0A151R1P3_CAJCA|nr:polyprotein [Cajanus cajan]
MTMVSTAYQTALDSVDEAIVEILTSGFSGQLKGWWHNYVSADEKHEILIAIKTDAEGNIITEKGEPIPDAVNTLIMAIVKHFIGDPSIWKDRSGELLSNLKCRTLGDFRGPNLNNNPRETRTCFKCGQQGHLAKFCRISSKVRELSLDPTILDQLNNLFINSSGSDEEDKQLSSDDIQADDDLSFSSDESFESHLIIVIHNDEQNLLLDALKSIQDPHERDEYLEKLKQILHKPKTTHSDNRFLNNKFDLTQTLKRLEKFSAKPVTILDLQTKICFLKSEVRDLKQKQQLHETFISQITEAFSDEMVDDNHNNLSNHSKQNTHEDDDLFTALINQCSIQKFYIDVTILIDDFVLNTVALFDTGADSNCILEGLIPTKYFNKTSEKLRTVSGSRLEIRYKLPSATIKNDRLIRKSKSPWSCTAFYVNKASEIERGAPRLVINYKPLNQALQWICDRYKTTFTVPLKKSPPP